LVCCEVDEPAFGLVIEIVPVVAEAIPAAAAIPTIAAAASAGIRLGDVSIEFLSGSGQRETTQPLPVASKASFDQSG
jgi:hypothetical protein